MRWVTTVWMSVVLMISTSALHLPIEHNLDTDQTSPPVLDTTEQDTVQGNRGPEQLAISAQIKDDESEAAASAPNSIGSGSNSGQSSNESEDLTEPNPDDSNSGPDTDNPDTITTTTTESDITPTTVSEATTVGEDNEPNTPPETSATSNEDVITTPGGNEGEETTPVPQNPVDTDVDTTTGLVRGYFWRDNTKILSYIDIKYGTFSNHFEAAHIPQKVADAPVHEEKTHRKRCQQLLGDEVKGDSDCLTLSIFKPFGELTGASVLVHIHEGNFISESADPAIYGPEYLVSEGIILVLPNYRLGPLGFLCLQNETAPGNAALKDLALALSWVKDNIVKFGGDPDNIAVSGEGTAGALAAYLALSPLSKNNVNKVIVESGSVLSHWALDRNPSVTATNLAQNIPGHWASWQTLDIKVLLTAARDIAWRPCLEKKIENVTHFILETPWSMLQKEDIDVTFMLGSAKYAGVRESLSHTTASIAQLNEDTSLLLPRDLQFESSEDKNRVGNQVKERYFGETITLDNMINRTLYYTDMSYLGPGVRTARALANSGSTVYFYEFSFVGDLNRELEAIEQEFDGAVRGDIIGYLFYQEGSMPAEDSKERKMILQLVELWTSFLKEGTPKTESIEWTKFEKATAAQEQWLSIGGETAMEEGVHVDRLGLWTDIYNAHFIDSSPAVGVSPSVYTVLVLQVVFFITFFRNAWHFF